MGLREVKSELHKLEKEVLIKLISELYKKFKPVKEYFDFYINPNEISILEKYKDKLREGFFPKRGYQIKLSISRKAVSYFKKLGTSNSVSMFVSRNVFIYKLYKAESVIDTFYLGNSPF